FLLLSLLRSVDYSGVVHSFPTRRSSDLPEGEAGDLPPGEALLWERCGGAAPRRVRVDPGRTVRRRHTRKYATGELPPERSFYFRSEEHTSELQSPDHLVCRLLLEKKKDI